MSEARYRLLAHMPHEDWCDDDEKPGDRTADHRLDGGCWTCHKVTANEHLDALVARPDDLAEVAGLYTAEQINEIAEANTMMM